MVVIVGDKKLFSFFRRKNYAMEITFRMIPLVLILHNIDYLLALKENYSLEPMEHRYGSQL